MSEKNKKSKLIISIFIICVSCILLFFPIIFSFSDYLSKTEKVNANLLIIEGWLPPYAIEMAYDEFKKNGYDLVITTGIKISEYYLVSTNGYLIFYTRDRMRKLDNPGDHTIEIEAYCELKEKNYAHFNVFVNDSMNTDFFADKKKRKYEIAWKGKLAKIDSVMIQFDNDRVNEYGDQNLYVKEIIFDHKTHIPYQNNSVYLIGELGGKKKLDNNYSSFAELARNRLLLMGLDSTLVLAIPGNRVRINRTLTSAIAFRDWLNASKIKVEGINIVTLGTHAKRTRMTYFKILNGTHEIGIISLPDYKNSHSRKNKVLKTLRETLGIIYYWLILIPY
jgi:hypothetical protein